MRIHSLGLRPGMLVFVEACSSTIGLHLGMMVSDKNNIFANCLGLSGVFVFHSPGTFVMLTLLENVKWLVYMDLYQSKTGTEVGKY